IIPDGEGGRYGGCRYPEVPKTMKAALENAAGLPPPKLPAPLERMRLWFERQNPPLLRGGGGGGRGLGGNSDSTLSGADDSWESRAIETMGKDWKDAQELDGAFCLTEGEAKLYLFWLLQRAANILDHKHGLREAVTGIARELLERRMI